MMDLNWCIENTVLAIDLLREKQSQHSDWVANLDQQRKNKKELDEVYWKTRGHQNKFDKYFSEAISNLNNLDSLEDEHNKGSVKEEGFLHRQSQIKNKLTDNFQKIIEIHNKIKNVFYENYIEEPRRDIIDLSYENVRDKEIDGKLKSVECDKKVNLINKRLQFEQAKSIALEKKVSYTLYELDVINSESSDKRTRNRISELSRYLGTWITE